MKNRKLVCFIVVIIILIAVIVGIYKAKYNSNYLYNEDGTISDGHQEIINRIRATENDEKRKEQIDFFLNCNRITQEEANELY